MATCNINGLLRHYVGSSLNGSVSNQVVEPICGNIEFTEIKDTKTIPTMAPRTVMEHKPVSAVLNGLSVAPDVHFSKEASDSVEDHSILRVSDPCGSSSNLRRIPGVASASNALISCSDQTNGYQGLEIRRVHCKRRLEACAERFDSIRDKSLALLNRLLAAKLPNVISGAGNHLTQPSESVCRLLDEEETESDSDEEIAKLSRGCSSLEENWLCTRAVTCSDWHWLVSEIRRSDRCIKNLRLVRSSLQKCKSNIALHDQHSNVEESCSRATPFVVRAQDRHSYHDLASPKCAQLIGKLNKGSNDPCVRCSCVPRHTGPCILCCGAPPATWIPPRDRIQCVDLLHSARPLGAHIHPKLSLPGDVQLSLRLESRLATPSNCTFREHKSTLHQVTEDDKPCCLKSPRKKIQRRIRRVNGFHSLQDVTDLESIANRYQELPHLPQPRASSSTTQSVFRPNQAPIRSHAKAVNAPSALRRILNLAPDSDASSEALREQFRDCGTH